MEGKKREAKGNKGNTKGRNVNVSSIKADPTGFFESIHSFALSLFFSLSLYHLSNSSPHLIKLVAFSRMREL